jgi:hypothetical protein
LVLEDNVPALEERLQTLGIKLKKGEISTAENE